MRVSDFAVFTDAVSSGSGSCTQNQGYFSCNAFKRLINLMKLIFAKVDVTNRNFGCEIAYTIGLQMEADLAIKAGRMVTNGVMFAWLPKRPLR